MWVYTSNMYDFKLKIQGSNSETLKVTNSLCKNCLLALEFGICFFF
ncbi:hypothetical protein D778_00730 [Xanthomarina gelatinilytica]|uniref:Uncharacterized protein n=1 Tax=Xanthomarina gelatinilytica TaxID=1137281 RepID=M7ME48_9FLAO|nr:hypothetical protein D778_00730 [Xanthomarina gelatinilytica]